MRFNKNDSVYIDPIITNSRTKARLQRNLLLLYTGLTRSSSTLLASQRAIVTTSPNKIKLMQKMADLATECKLVLEKGKIADFGTLLHENWMLKRQLANGISISEVDYWYKMARKHGALGGKLCGAGGGGFLLLYAPYDKHKSILNALKTLRPIGFELEPQGSKIIYVS